MNSLRDVQSLLEKHNYVEAYRHYCALSPDSAASEEGLLVKGILEHRLFLFRSAEDSLNPLAHREHWLAEYWLGRNSISREAPLKAMDFFRRANRFAPDEERSALCLSYLARVEGGCKRLQSAQRHMNKALQTKSAAGEIAAEIHCNAGVLLTAVHSFDAALDMFRDAQLAQPVRVETSCHLANLWLLKNETRKARQELESALAQFPQDIALNLLLGDVLRLLDEKRAAVEAYQRAIKTSPAGAMADYAGVQAGNCHYDLADIAGAVACYRDVRTNFKEGPLQQEAGYFLERITRSDAPMMPRKRIANFPNDVAKPDYCGPTALANVFDYWGRWTDPDKIADALFENGVSNWKITDYARHLGFAAVSFSGTADTLKSLLEMDVPVIVDEYEGLDGHYLVVVGYDDCKGVFVAQDPNLKEPVEIAYPEFEVSWQYSNRWSALIIPRNQAKFLEDFQLPGFAIMREMEKAEYSFDQRNYTTCADISRDLIKQHQDFGPALRLLVKTEMLQERWDAAAAKLKIWLQRYPNCLWALKYIADCYHESNNFFLAAKYYRETLDQYPKEYGAAALLGHSLMKLDNYKEAAEWLKKSLELNPSYDWPYTVMGEALEAAGKPHEAVRYYRIALELNSNYTWIPDKIAKLESDTVQ